MKRFAVENVALPGCSSIPIAGAVRAGERVYLSGASALRADGTVVGPGDAAAQTHAALDRLEASLKAAGGSLANLTKLTTCVVDRGFRRDVYGVIAERASECAPGQHRSRRRRTALPELIVQIDAEAAIPSQPRPLHPALHVRQLVRAGLSLARLDGRLPPTRSSSCAGRPARASTIPGCQAKGRSLADAGAQADLAMTNLATPPWRGRRLDGGCLQDHGLYQRPRLSPGRLSDDRQAFRRCPPGLDRHHHDGLRPARYPVRDRCRRRPRSRKASRISGCAPIIPAPRNTVTKASSSTASSAWRSSPAIASSCAARPVWASTRSSTASATPKRRPSRRWTMSRPCWQKPARASTTSSRRRSMSPIAPFWPTVNETVLRRLGDDRAGLHHGGGERARQPGAADGSRYRRHQGERADDILDRRTLRPDRHARSRGHDLVDRGRITLCLCRRRHRRRADPAYDRPAARAACARSAATRLSRAEQAIEALQSATPQQRLAPARDHRPGRDAPRPLRGRERQTGARRGAWPRLRRDRQYRALGTRCRPRWCEAFEADPDAHLGGAADRCAEGRR